MNRRDGWSWVITLVAMALVGFVVSLSHTLAGKANHQTEAMTKIAQESYLEIAELRLMIEDLFKVDLSKGPMEREQVWVTITGYSARPQETDSTPELTADMTPSRIGLLAVSRDLLSEVGLRYGQRVLLQPYGLFEVRDTMNKRFTRRVDILHATPEAARLFGKREGQLIWVK